jgi:preprotein translocase subunit YajC
MYVIVPNVILADAAGAPAPTTQTAAPAGTPAGQTMQNPTTGLLIPLVLMIVMLYFMIFRPQSQQRKRQEKLLQALKSGDKVVTASGILGQVITVKDTTVSLRSADAKMEVTKSSIIEIRESSSSTDSKADHEK